MLDRIDRVVSVVGTVASVTAILVLVVMLVRMLATDYRPADDTVALAALLALLSNLIDRWLA